MTEQDVVGHLKEIMRGRNEAVIDARWVEKLNSRHKLEKRILVITESSFSLYQIKTFSRVPRLSKRFSWFKLKKLELVESKKIRFSFTEDVVIVTEAIFSILSNLIPHIRKILTDGEMPELLLQQFNIEELTSKIDSASRGVLRLKARLYTERPNVPDDLINSYIKFLKSEQHELNIKCIAIHHYYQQFLDSLRVVPQVVSLEVPTSEISHWSEFGQFLANSLYIKEFITSEKIDKNFSDFAAQLKKEKNKPLKSITFKCPKIMEADIPIITNIIKDNQIESLTIVHCLNVNHTEKFCNGLASATSLKKLIIDHVESIDPIKVLQILPKIEHIAITNSLCELSSVMTSLSQIPNLEVKTLDLSGNIFKSSIKKKVSLCSIRELILDNVDFRDDSFKTLFTKAIAIYPNPLSLSYYNIKIERPKLVSFMKVIDKLVNKNVELKLTDIYWESGTISPKFFVLLELCSNLRVLSISGCLNGNDTGIIGNLTEFISSTTIVTDIRLSGTEKSKFSPDSLIAILNSFKEDNRVIKRIDISNNKMNSEVFNVLGDVLMKNRAIEYIDFRYNENTNPDDYNKLFHILLQRGRPLDFPTPYKEFQEMLNLNLITEENITDFKLLEEKIHSGNPLLPFPLESVKLIGDAKKPIYQQEQESDEDYSEDDWTIYTVPAPEIDNYEIESILSEEFSIQKIIERIRSR